MRSMDARAHADHDNAVTDNDYARSEVPRRATTADAMMVALMRHDFKTEFETRPRAPRN